jgi:hypothetical protein
MGRTTSTTRGLLLILMECLWVIAYRGGGAVGRGLGRVRGLRVAPCHDTFVRAGSSVPSPDHEGYHLNGHEGDCY